MAAFTQYVASVLFGVYVENTVGSSVPKSGESNEQQVAGARLPPTAEALPRESSGHRLPAGCVTSHRLCDLSPPNPPSPAFPAVAWGILVVVVVEQLSFMGGQHATGTSVMGEPSACCLRHAARPAGRLHHA